MDADPAPNGETSTDQPDSTEQGRESRLSLTLGEASTLIAASGALIYVLGVIALWAPIAKFYTNDFDTAWYAASLFPRVVAAGQGVKQLYGPLIVLCATVASIFVWQYTIYKARDNINYVLFALAALFVVSGIAFFIWLGRAYGSRGSVIPPVLFSLVLSWGIACNMGVLMKSKWIITRLFGLEYRKDEALPKIRSDRTLAIALAVLMSYVIVLGFIRVVFFTEPTLPYVEMSAQSHIDGNLLTHVDGFWYIFEDRGEHKGDLIAVPDDAVNTVLIHPRGQ
jgi:hypothetical protein